jgi:pyrroline-5-carboxylate reductase
MSVLVVLAGCGNMGFAMLSGWLRSDRLLPHEVLVVEPNEELRGRAEGLGARTAADAGDIPEGITPEVVIFAVKPQVMRDVVPAYRRFVSSETSFLSVAAGTSIATIENALGGNPAVIRCMPNTPASVGKGMMVTVANGRVSPETEAFVDELLATSGEVARIEDEALMDAVTAVSGSGPAYVFHVIECLASAGERAGLPAEIAKRLALQTVYGAGCLAAESREEPARLREQVTSPNGTTAAALAVLMGGDKLKTLIGDAVEAARRRSVELGQSG